MENLFTMEDEKFTELVETMPIEDLQNLIWELENELRKKENSSKSEIQSNPEVDRLGIEKPSQHEQILERSSIRRKIHICRNTMQSRLYRIASDKKVDEMSMLYSRWGIVERTPEVIIANAPTGKNCWRKYGGNEPVLEPIKMTMTHVGDFYWNNRGGLSIKEQSQNNIRFAFDVPSRTANDKVELDAEEIIKGYKQERNRYTNLKLVKVTIHGATNLEYFMLMDIEQMDEISSEKLQQFLAMMYMSNVHQGEIEKSITEGRCLYGGIISQNPNGNLQVRFRERDITATATANKSSGTFISLSKKEEKVGVLQQATDYLNGRQKRQEALRALQEIRTGVESR